MSKQEATRLADALTKPSDWLPYYGVQWHPQPHVVDEAAALLRRWPDGEPTPMDAIYAAWHGAGVDIAGGNWDRFVSMLPPTLFTPPDAAARITALEAEVGDLRDSCAAKADRIDRLGETVVRLSATLKVAGEALWICAEHNALHHGDQHNTTTQARTVLQQIKEAQR